MSFCSFPSIFCVLGFFDLIVSKVHNANTDSSQHTNGLFAAYKRTSAPNTHPLCFFFICLFVRFLHSLTSTGLFLDRCFFKLYNSKLIKSNLNNPPLDLDQYSEQIEAFKRAQIYPKIVELEIQQQVSEGRQSVQCMSVRLWFAISCGLLYSTNTKLAVTFRYHIGGQPLSNSHLCGT